MDQRDPILTVECSEPEGQVTRHVRPVSLTGERLRFYWEHLKKFDVLFNDFYAGDSAAFIKMFVDQGPGGELRSIGLIWEVDDVGIFYLTQMAPGHQGHIHFTFWDSRLRGRIELGKEMLIYLMKTFKFHRLVVEVPLYAHKALFRAVESLGFKKEGRMREAALYKGQWFDVNLYAILNHEVLNGRLS